MTTIMAVLEYTEQSGAIRAQGLTVRVPHPGGRESGHLSSPTAALNASSGYAELSILKETGLR